MSSKSDKVQQEMPFIKDGLKEEAIKAAQNFVNAMQSCGDDMFGHNSADENFKNILESKHAWKVLVKSIEALKG